MLITQLRNATVLLEFQHAGRPVGLLVDPMLAPRGSLPALRYLGPRRHRNPLVDLPAQADAALQRVTHALITQLRNATVLLEFQHAGRPVGLLVDPMLAPRGSLPALRYLGTRRQRNPLVDLPAEVAQAAALTTGAVVVNHLEALDHCPTTRAQVRALAQRGGWAHRLWVPEDGECRYYPVPTVKSDAMNSVAAEA